MRIAVLGGGLSPERDVSKKSASLIANALLSKGHEVAVIDLYDGTSEDPESLYRKGTENPYSFDIPEEEPDLEKLIAENGGRREWVGPGVIELCKSADCVFIGLHGSYGENGQIQSVLDSYNIKHTGCNYLGCAIAMDKAVSKALVAGAGLRTAQWFTKDPDSITPQEIMNKIGLPCVVKPIGTGSSCGVSVVKHEDELPKAIKYAAKYGQLILTEHYISGREITISILGDRALPVTEIIPHEGFYDYKNKYQSGLTTHVCPANLTEAETARAQELALRIFRILRMSSYGRIDMIYAEQEGKFYFIEANNLPGMTNTSLLPEAAAAVGIKYEDLCEQIALECLK
ncbi:D-alanine-D-alanine ligase [Ruminococcaceae bacterium YRB3002]|nr:D-alanine-D-alanine ligase [Ruminococcaceae bacterium YRB3002]